MSIYNYTKLNNNNTLNLLGLSEDQSPLADAKKNTKIKFLPSNPQYGSLGTPVIFSTGSGFNIETTLSFPNPTLSSGTVATGYPIFGLSKSSINLVSGGQGHKPGDLFEVVSEKTYGVIQITEVNSNGSATDFSILQSGRNFDNGPTIISYIPKFLFEQDPDYTAPSELATFEFVPDQFAIIDIKVSNTGSGYKIFTNTTLDTYIISANGSGQNFSAVCNVGPLLQLNENIESSKKISLYDKRYRINSNTPDSFNNFNQILSDNDNIFTLSDVILTTENNIQKQQHYTFDHDTQQWKAMIVSQNTILSDGSTEPQCETINPEDSTITVIASIDPITTLVGIGSTLAAGQQLTSQQLLLQRKTFTAYKNIVLLVCRALVELESRLDVNKIVFSNIDDPLVFNALRQSNKEVLESFQNRLKKIFEGVKKLDCNVLKAVTELDPHSPRFKEYLFRATKVHMRPPVPGTTLTPQQQIDNRERAYLWKALDKTQRELNDLVKRLAAEQANNEFNFGCNKKPDPKIRKKRSWWPFSAQKAQCTKIKLPTGVNLNEALKGQNIVKPKKGPNGITGIAIFGGMVALDYWCSEIASAEEIELVSPGLVTLEAIGGLMDMADPCSCNTLASSSEAGYEEIQLGYSFKRLLQYYLLSDATNDDDIFVELFGSFPSDKLGGPYDGDIVNILTDIGVSAPFTPENVLNQLKVLKEQLQNDISEEKTKYLLNLQYKKYQLYNLNRCLDPNDSYWSDLNLELECPEEICEDSATLGSMPSPSINISIEIPIQDLINSNINPPKSINTTKCY